MFVALLEEVVGRYDFVVHGYALMPNHFHLMVQTPRGNLSHGMRHLVSRFAMWLNQERGWDGPLFRGRYKNFLVEDDAYWMHLLAYLHLNPVRAGLARRVEETRWTSHEAYVGAASVPAWLTVSELLAAFGGIEGYERYVGDLRKGAVEEPEVFDRHRLFVPQRREALEREVGEAREVPVPTFTPEQALTAVRLVTGVREPELLKARLGPGGSPERWLAMWWLSRAARLTQAEIGRMFGTTKPAVSRSIARVRGSIGQGGPLGDQAGRLLDLLS